MRSFFSDNKINIIDYILISLISLGSCCFLYKFLFKICGYANLKDFYFGSSIYENHNKFLDIWMFFIYFVLFFCILFIYRKIKRYIPKFEFNFYLPDINFQYIISKNKNFIMILETVFSLLYTVLHPFNGHFYIPVFIFICACILFSIYDAYINLYKKENPSISIFAFIPLLYRSYITYNS